MLQNRIYRGEIVHKEASYRGEYDAIVDETLWTAAQAALSGNAIERSAGKRARNPSLLAALLFDVEDVPISLTHAVKQGRRYRKHVKLQ